MSAGTKKAAPRPAPAPQTPAERKRELVLGGLKAFNADTRRAPISFSGYERELERALAGAPEGVSYPTAYTIKRFFATMPEAWAAAGVTPEPGEAPMRSKPKKSASAAAAGLLVQLDRLAAELTGVRAAVEQLEMRAASAETARDVAEGALEKARRKLRKLAEIEL